ncbi:cytochrome P450 [Clohesyomyces aquaticus]|uniref:Cytochrome P450 n=1 Tax=Clohesyomyces aquaticus TaxID=1231657 RepID=A0A1Y2A953_9PLEO|nr:cytochrome P450 [Clohesyomyces aquaticus]
MGKMEALSVQDLSFSGGLKLVVYLFALRCALVYTYRWFFSPLSRFSGPFLAKFSDWPLAYHSVRGNLHLRALETHERYGPVVRVGPNKVSFSTETALHTIFTSKSVQKHKGYQAFVTIPGVYSSFTVIDKDVHRFKRKIINQGLSEQRMRDAEPAMNKLINRFINIIAKACKTDQWSPNFNMTDSCKYLGVDVMAQFGFGQSFNLQESEENRFFPEAAKLMNLIVGVYYNFTDLAKAKLHVIFAKRALALRDKIRPLMQKIVSERIAVGKNAYQDLFNFVLEAKDPETGKGFALPELWMEAQLLLIAGSDTSATTMAALLFYLSRYPDCHRKLADEIRGAFEDVDDIHSGKAMSECIYLRACIDEALRMSGPAAGIGWREVSPGTGGIIIDGHHIPEGFEVGLSSYVIHHNESFFPEPFTFKPERWIVSPENPKEQVERSRRAFAPFSLGPRGCAGRAMAYMEISNVIAKTVWCFDFEPSKGEVGKIGEGKPNGERGRRRPKEFQTYEHLTSSHDGPYLRFRLRHGFSGNLST